LEEVKAGLLAFLPLADGVTISEGEPFDQPEVLQALLQWLRDTLWQSLRLLRLHVRSAATAPRGAMN
jgi:hypothetical protein